MLAYATEHFYQILYRSRFAAGSTHIRSFWHRTRFAYPARQGSHGSALAQRGDREHRALAGPSRLRAIASMQGRVFACCEEPIAMSSLSTL